MLMKVPAKLNVNIFVVILELQRSKIFFSTARREVEGRVRAG